MRFECMENFPGLEQRGIGHFPIHKAATGGRGCPLFYLDGTETAMTRLRPYPPKSGHSLAGAAGGRYTGGAASETPQASNE